MDAHRGGVVTSAHVVIGRQRLGKASVAFPNFVNCDVDAARGSSPVERRVDQLSFAEFDRFTARFGLFFAHFYLIWMLKA